MKHKTPSILLLALLALAAFHVSEASPSTARLLIRRQASSGETEQEGTTPAATGAKPVVETNVATQSPPAGVAANRPLEHFYPALPNAGHGDHQVGPFGPHLYPPHHQQTPFVPFGVQYGGAPRPAGPGFANAPNGFMGQPQGQPMTLAERLQAQTSGLGKRLLQMVGIDTSQNGTQQAAAGAAGQGAPMDPMRALRNSTVLQQLNGGLHSVYDGLSKMYNNTVQQQLAMLQERFKKEGENSTSPWAARMSQQIPAFFKGMAARVDNAQAQLNNLWQQVTLASNNTNQPGQPGQPGQANQRPNNWGIDHMFNDGSNGNFFRNIGHQLGFGGQPDPSVQGQPGNPPNDVGSQLRGFWHNQVAPQVDMVRSQIARTWRDLTSTGVLQPQPIFNRRINQADAQAPGMQSNDSGPVEIVNDILKSIDLSSPEYSLIEPKSDSATPGQDGHPGMDQKQQVAPNAASTISTQMQNRLISMQRDLNQLWSGLSNSLQGALSNVQQTLNPQPQFVMMGAQQNKRQEMRPEDSEMNQKIKDMQRVQRDADAVYSVVQQQQQQESFGNRFKNFFNNVDMTQFDQFSNKVGEQFHRFGNAVGDFWNGIPDRWNNFMSNNRPPNSGVVSSTPASAGSSI